jgi:hypothetical protein
VQILVESAERFSEEIRTLATSGVTVARDEVGERLSVTFDRLFEGTKLMHEWQIVMAITFAETFLHDVLVECAQVDPTVLGEAQPTTSFSEVSVAESLEALKHEMFSKWARSFVDDGGPTKWTRRLTVLGVRGLPTELRELEEAWGIRHSIVHRAGVVSTDFARRHPSLKGEVGEHIDLSAPQVIRYVELIDQFVLPIDASFAARFVARGAATRAPAV